MSKSYESISSRIIVLIKNKIIYIPGVLFLIIVVVAAISILQFELISVKNYVINNVEFHLKAVKINKNIRYFKNNMAKILYYDKVKPLNYKSKLKKILNRFKNRINKVDAEFKNINAFVKKTLSYTYYVPKIIKNLKKSDFQWGNINKPILEKIAKYHKYIAPKISYRLFSKYSLALSSSTISSKTSIKEQLSYFKYITGIYIYIFITVIVIIVILGILFIYCMDKFYRTIKESKQKSENSALFYKSMFDDHAAVMLLLDETGKIIDANDASVKFFGYSKEILKTMYNYDIDTAPKDEALDYIKQIYNKEKSYFTFIHKLKNGELRDVDVHSSPIYINGKVYIYSIIHDVTEKRKLKEAKERVSGMYQTLSAVNEALLQLKNEQDLFEKVCSATLQYPRFILSWIGLVDYETKKVNIVAKAGFDDGYVDGLIITIDPENPASHGPAATAIKESRIIVNIDTKSNPAMAPWKEDALKRGYFSSATVPIRKKDNVIGVFSIYANIPEAFDEGNLKLLDELGKDISLCLDKIEDEKWTQTLSKAIEQSSDWFFTTDKDYNIEYINKAVEEISGYSAKELIGKNPRIFGSGIQDKEFYKKFYETINSGEIFRAVFINRKKTGALFYLDDTIIPIKADNKIIRFTAYGKDLSREKALEEQITNISLYDPVTKLHNREFFFEEADNYIKRAKRTETTSALVVIDIFKFTYINDTFGTRFGDGVLKSVAQILKNTLRESDVVSRLGSDSFGILLTDLNMKEDIIKIVENLKESLKLPIKIKEQEISLTFHFGISLYPDDAQEIEELFKAADIALSYAKKESEWECRFFETDMNIKASKFLLIKKNMVNALKKEEFVIHYQPYFDCQTQKLAGFEALLRWNSAGNGLIQPLKFIPILEETGMITDVERWLIKGVCTDIKSWENKGLKAAPVSINISPVSFRKKDVDKKILDAVKKHELNPNYINIEITESVFLENMRYAIDVLKTLRENSIKISIDDFGTGYSSMSYLKTLPADIIKIDISFIRNITVNHQDFAITETIIDLAHRLNMITIAEGVETKEQFELLKSVKCDIAQGYLFSKPVPLQQAEAFLEKAGRAL